MDAAVAGHRVALPLAALVGKAAARKGLPPALVAWRCSTAAANAASRCKQPLIPATVIGTTRIQGELGGQKSGK